MIVYLLRHGTPVGGRMYRGNLFDDPLTEEGWNQMKSSVADLSFDLIATSPMKRCSEFAKYISIKTETPYLIIDDFREIGFGDWQGKTSQQIGEDAVKRFKNDPLNNPVNNAENLYDFQSRVIKNYIEILEKLNPKNKLLIIAHAGVIRVIKSDYLNTALEDIFTIEVPLGKIESIELF